MDRNLIETVSHFKFLGITLDSTLNFELHYQLIYKKLSQFSFIIRKLSLVLPTSCLRTLYFAYCHSNLTYGFMIWYPLIRKCSQQMLYVLQKRLVCAINKISPHQHCMPFFKQDRIPTLQDQLKLENCKLIHRILNKDCPVTICRLFDGIDNNADNNVKTRSQCIGVQSHRNHKFNLSFLSKSVIDWSKLKVDLKRIGNTRLFAKHLKNGLIDKY